MPESSARECIKDLTGDNHGLFWYCKDEDYLEVDEEYVDDFYENMECLLHRGTVANQRIKKLEEELSAYINLYSKQKRYSTNT